MHKYYSEKDRDRVSLQQISNVITETVSVSLSLSLQQQPDKSTSRFLCWFSLGSGSDTCFVFLTGCKSHLLQINTHPPTPTHWKSLDFGNMVMAYFHSMEANCSGQNPKPF